MTVGEYTVVHQVPVYLPDGLRGLVPNGAIAHSCRAIARDRMTANRCFAQERRKGAPGQNGEGFNYTNAPSAVECA